MDNSFKENTKTKDISGLLSQLRDIGDRIQADDVGKESAWGGADVIISDKAPEDDHSDSWRSPPKYVITPYAAELSWLFCRLRDTFGSYIDYVSKHEFFGRLSKAAYAYSASTDTNAKLQGLLMATLDEAVVMANEIPAEEGLMSNTYSYLCPRCNADYENDKFSGLSWTDVGLTVNDCGNMKNIGYLHCSECGANSPLYVCKEYAENGWCVQELNRYSSPSN